MQVAPPTKGNVQRHGLLKKAGKYLWVSGKADIDLPVSSMGGLDTGHS